MTDWTQITIDGVKNFWQGFIEFIPNLIIALVIFIIGWIISALIGRIITEILRRLKLDKFFEARGWKEAMDKAEMKTTISGFIGSLCKWILILVFLAISVRILNVEEFSEFILRVVAWLPNLLVAVLIFVVTVVIASFAEKSVRATIGKAKLEHANLAGAIVRWAIWIFGIFAILLQLGIAQEIIQALLYGFVAIIALAGGLAFGLGGKDLAADLLNSARHRIKK